MDRRKFIAAAGATVTSISIAGCADPDDAGTAGNGTGDGDGDGTDTDVGGGDTETDAGGGDTETVDEADTQTNTGEDTTNGGTAGGVDPSQVEGDTEDVSQYVEVTEHEAFAEGEDVGVRGTIENTSDRTLDYVETEVTLNDGDTVLGEFIDTSDDDIDTLPAGETYDFEVTFDDEVWSEGTTYTISVDAEPVDNGTGGTETETTA